MTALDRGRIDTRETASMVAIALRDETIDGPYATFVTQAAWLASLLTVVEDDGARLLTEAFFCAGSGPVLPSLAMTEPARTAGPITMAQAEADRIGRAVRHLRAVDARQRQDFTRRVHGAWHTSRQREPMSAIPTGDLVDECTLYGLPPGLEARRANRGLATPRVVGA